MPPMFGQPNYNFDDTEEDYGEYKQDDENSQVNLTHMAFWYMVVLIGMLLSWLVIFFCLRIITLGQKTRNQPQRRGVFVGSRERPSAQPEPTIYVSPANLPPPPKYEALAPPSYEEVMAAAYPDYPATQPQPITYPLTHAAQASSSPPRSEEPPQSTVITVTSDERRTSVTVATS
ncbi:uncharacterized protein LOC106131730 isoform X1 [Amyelois transitella]|uniref:uncharacterized protein LOC106131730 isoform X1 n=1 Tax=Amyelois transitella TaxID=680683 RepID=UPI00298F493D|nr:uncharacterized protein LOC106131730 isoform X1 [Amyelois transitella]